MSDQRATILAGIRRALGVRGDEAFRREDVSARLRNPPDGITPIMAKGDASTLVERFIKNAQNAQATLDQVSDGAGVVAAIMGYLRAHNLPRMCRMGADERLADLPWETAPMLSISQGASSGDDPVAVSYGVAAIAESGTIMLGSGPDNPTTLNFLPDTHIVVVARGDIVGAMEAAWERLRGASAHHSQDMPRCVNLVTGPSRSADIEQTLLLGAHGPRRLHIVLQDA